MIVLLVIKPGPLRDGLDALLFAMPEVQLVVHANDANASLDFCRQGTTDVVILEVRPGDRDLLAKVSDVKALCPQGQALALIHNEEDRGPAEAAGADSVLSVGMPATRLRGVITEIASSDMGE
jgi:DNA-binding NarL/FixJ family response regulator